MKRWQATNIRDCDFDYITKTGEKLNNRRYTVRKPTFSQKQTAKEYK